MSSDCAMWAADGNGDGKYDLLAASNKLASPNSGRVASNPEIIRPRSLLQLRRLRYRIPSE